MNTRVEPTTINLEKLFQYNFSLTIAIDFIRQHKYTITESDIPGLYILSNSIELTSGQVLNFAKQLPPLSPVIIWNEATR